METLTYHTTHQAHGNLITIDAGRNTCRSIYIDVMYPIIHNYTYNLSDLLNTVDIILWVYYWDRGKGYTNLITAVFFP